MVQQQQLWSGAGASAAAAWVLLHGVVAGCRLLLLAACGFWQLCITAEAWGVRDVSVEGGGGTAS